MHKHYGYWSYDEGYGTHKSIATEYIVLYEKVNDGNLNAPNRSWLMVWL